MEASIWGKNAVIVSDSKTRPLCSNLSHVFVVALGSGSEGVGNKTSVICRAMLHEGESYITARRESGILDSSNDSDSAKEFLDRILKIRARNFRD